jgi:phosphoribosyl-ATP pyrophosphohydrolase
MGFHRNIITRGIYGEISKVREELEEAEDAIQQGQTLMLLVELADIIGACAGVAAKHGLSINDLVAFAQLRSKVAMEEEASAPTGNGKSLASEYFDNCLNERWRAHHAAATRPNNGTADDPDALLKEQQQRLLRGGLPSIGHSNTDDPGLLEVPDRSVVTTVATPTMVLGPVIPKREA